MSLVGLYLFPYSLKSIRIKSVGILYCDDFDLIRSRKTNIYSNF
nr:MAG TPA: hypothetical protein [Caudoviricetes sp.]